MVQQKIEILFLSKQEVESLITVKDAVYACEQAYKCLGEGQLAHYSTVMPMKGPNLTITMTAYLKSLNLYGMKQVSPYSVREPGDNIPYIWGSLVVLTHVENGLPYAIMDGTSITKMRTAGGHAVVAAKYLAKKDSKKLAIIGCGAEGRAGFRSFLNTFPIELVKIYDVKSEAMHAFKEEVGREFAVRIIPVDSPQKAVEGTDIVLVVSTASEPVVLEPWVEKGAFVAALTCFRDVDPMLSVKADKWVLGILEEDSKTIIEGHGLPTLNQMQLSRDNVYADMGEIVSMAKPGRENDQERIVYTHMGMGGHDVVLAQIAYTRAVEKGIGTRLYL